MSGRRRVANGPELLGLRGSPERSGCVLWLNRTIAPCGVLIEDARHCFCDNGRIIPGDHNLRYLVCNEKFVFLFVEDAIWTWESGESSFDIVEAYVQEINSMGFFTPQQYDTLIGKIAEAA
jgi:hypothetical protein